MIKNSEIFYAWKQGRHKSTGILGTDGNTLFSYALKIGERVNGKLVVYDYTVPGGNFYSITTSTHVNAAKPFADRIVDFNRTFVDERW